MTWSNTIRAAVSGLTSLYPAVLSPLNGEDLGQTNMADGFGRLSTAIDSLRSASWHSDELTIAADLGSGRVTGSTPWTNGELAAPTDLLHTWLSATAVATTGRLVFSIPHAIVADLYLSGATVISRHAGTPHTTVPGGGGGACFLEFYSVGAGAPGGVGSYPIASFASAAEYDALQAYRITISGTRPRLNATAVIQAAFRSESGVDAQIGREVRGILWHFSKNAA